MPNENERGKGEGNHGDESEYTRIYAVAQFGIGQLVACHGYPGEVFEVDVVKIESLRGIDFESTGVYYELIGIHSDLIIEGAQEDMTLVADVHEADDYIRANTGDKLYGEAFGMDMFGFGGYDSDYGASKAKKQTETEKQQATGHRAREKAEIKRRKDYRETVELLMDAYNEFTAGGLKKDAKETKAEYDRVTAQFNAESAILMAGGELGGVNPVYSAKEESE